MSVTFRVSPQLQASTNGAEKVVLTGKYLTVRDALDDL